MLHGNGDIVGGTQVGEQGIVLEHESRATLLWRTVNTFGATGPGFAIALDFLTCNFVKPSD